MDELQRLYNHICEVSDDFIETAGLIKDYNINGIPESERGLYEFSNSIIGGMLYDFYHYYKLMVYLNAPVIAEGNITIGGRYPLKVGRKHLYGTDYEIEVLFDGVWKFAHLEIFKTVKSGTIYLYGDKVTKPTDRKLEVDDNTYIRIRDYDKSKIMKIEDALREYETIEEINEIGFKNLCKEIANNLPEKSADALKKHIDTRQNK